MFSHKKHVYDVRKVFGVFIELEGHKRSKYLYHSLKGAEV